MSQKSPEAFRTISEVADELDVPQHVLRFWESKFAAVKPLKRGGGRRYYRPADVDVLLGVKTLLYGEGYTIRGVQRILKEQGPRFVIGAGRGDLSGLPAPEADDDLDEEVDALGAVDASDGGGLFNGDDRDGGLIEPTFDPREFRPREAAPTVNGAGARKLAGLSGDDVRRLQATLTDLLELKRLLDQTRD